MSTGRKQKLEDALQRVRKAYHQRIVAELKGTDKSYRQIALDIGVSEGLVYLVNRLSRSRTAPEQMVGEEEWRRNQNEIVI